jgi:hypothetical protein
MRDNLGVLEFELTPDQLDRINQLDDFDPGFPRAFLHSENVRSLIHGKTFTRLDNHRA